MKLLITGGCGFIGSNFILNRMKSNPDDIIINCDKVTYSGSTDNLKSVELKNNYKHIDYDICDSLLIKSLFHEFKPDSLIHFAAESHVDRSIHSPFDFVNTNVNGTVNLLNETMVYLNDNSDKYNSFKFIHISTDEVFGSLGPKGVFTENSKFYPNSPYSASKAASDHFVRSWNKTYRLPTIITNCSNNYGPRQFPEKLIPLMITNCIDGFPLPIYGNGTNVRDWVHVIDHCNAISTILDNGIVGECYNVGGNNELTNNQIVNDICEILDELHPQKTIYRTKIN